MHHVGFCRRREEGSYSNMGNGKKKTKAEHMGHESATDEWTRGICSTECFSENQKNPCVGEKLIFK